MSGYGFVMGTCWGCKRPFCFNPHKVPSLPIGPDGQPAPNGEKEPICESCMNRFNARRVAAGLAPLPILPGAYDAAPIEEI